MPTGVANRTEQARQVYTATSTCRSRPAEFLHCKTRVPDFRHLTDLISTELHYVDVVRNSLFPGRLTGTAGTGMGARKDGISRDVVTFSVGSEGFQLVASVRHEGHQALHPIGVFRKRLYTGERFSLGCKSSVGSAESFAVSRDNLDENGASIWVRRGGGAEG